MIAYVVFTCFTEAVDTRNLSIPFHNPATLDQNSKLLHTLEHYTVLTHRGHQTTKLMEGHDFSC